MDMSINKDTKLYASFSNNAGNRGCEFFNAAFKKYHLNCIYKSFSVSDIHEALNSADVLKFSGCAISMPFKKEAFELMDNLDDSALKSKSVNTVIFNHDTKKWKGYNTDYYAAGIILDDLVFKHKEIYILGNGGLASSVLAKSSEMGFEVKKITRDIWSDILSLRGKLIFNCTPVVDINYHSSNDFIDCVVGTHSGDLFYRYQSHKQFELYTGIKYEV